MPPKRCTFSSFFIFLSSYFCAILSFYFPVSLSLSLSPHITHTHTHTHTLTHYSRFFSHCFDFWLASDAPLLRGTIMEGIKEEYLPTPWHEGPWKRGSSRLRIIDGLKEADHLIDVWPSLLLLSFLSLLFTSLCSNKDLLAPAFGKGRSTYDTENVLKDHNKLHYWLIPCYRHLSFIPLSSFSPSHLLPPSMWQRMTGNYWVMRESYIYQITKIIYLCIVWYHKFVVFNIVLSYIRLCYLYTYIT